VSLESLKEKAEKDSASAKSLIARLNKEISTQKSSIEAFKNALEKTKEEKEKLTKSAQSNLASNKKIAEAQAATKKSEDALKDKTAELESEKAVGLLELAHLVFLRLPSYRIHAFPLSACGVT
jgi:nucleoprotein TPR